mmetsp:Transcript_20459/g.32751  ORF Transcript_20459/g.32751 Transcript_20459/m.32751 type:complete len:161 (+) Transcript_20459:72-554(+)
MSDRQERPRRFHPSSDPLPRLTEFRKTRIPPPKNDKVKFKKTLQSQLRSPILKEFHAKLDKVTQPIVVDEQRRKQMAVTDTEYEWFKQVFSDWHPDMNAQLSARHDEAFLKWYNNVIVSELQRIANLHQPPSTMDPRCPSHTLPVIEEDIRESDIDSDSE